MTTKTAADELAAYKAAVSRALEFIETSAEAFLPTTSINIHLAASALRDVHDEPEAPDFFQPGHAYTHRDGSDFRCVAVTTHPESGKQVALGWHTDTAGWTFVGVRNNDQWNHEYDGCKPPADTAGGGR